MEKVVQAGLPVWRFYTGLQLIHPQLQAMGYAWRRGQHVEAIARAYGIQLTSAYIGSPIQEVREQGHAVRYRLDRQGGFSDADIEDLTRLVDMIGAIMEMHIEHGVADTVANTYLGRQISERVLNGAIRRGEGEEIRAVLWFSDMRDFTGLNERLPPDQVLELLNNYFQLVGDALSSHGGEILKFIGDGVMGYFPAEDALFLPMVTAAALGAARQLITDVEAANEARATGGAEPLRFGIGLHVGDVTFGNIGTEDRLDFTVIGSAVNRASRLEGLTKALGVKVCASAEFNENCPQPMKSLGVHRLRGVPKPVEIFTLPD